MFGQLFDLVFLTAVAVFVVKAKIGIAAKFAHLFAALGRRGMTS